MAGETRIPKIVRDKKLLLTTIKYKDPKVLKKKCEEYFKYADDKKEFYTVPGLALFLGFCTRQAVFEYLQKEASLASVMRQAVLTIEDQRVQQLLGNGNTAGKIFDLVNNFDYKNEYRAKIGGTGDPLSVSVLTILDGQEIETTGRPKIKDD